MTRYNDGAGCRPYFSPSELATGADDTPCICVPIGESKLTRFDPRCRQHYPRKRRTT